MFFSELIPGQWITRSEIAKDIKSFISRCGKKVFRNYAQYITKTQNVFN